MYYLLWFFFIYAFLGWCTEVCFVALKTGTFVNRGFLNGPVCPIYGFGALVVLTALEPLRDHLLLLFLGSMALTSLLEYLTGLLLEKLFHQRWWDYSDEPFNLGGYICLRFSVGWGLACLFAVKILHPSVLLLIGFIPRTLGWVLLALFGASMAADLTATVRTIAKINRRLGQIDELAAKIRSASNDLGENLADRVLDAAEKGADLREVLDGWADDMAQRRDELNQLKDDLSQRSAAARSALRGQLDEWKNSLQTLLDKEAFGQRRLLRAFPKMRSTDHKSALERLRRRMERR